MELVTVAHVYTDFLDKFGVPRQSGTEGARGRIVFDKPYSSPDSVRGLMEYSHIWVLWGFSCNPRQQDFAPTVRPPRLGGNVRMGVWATRSPNRPNPIAMSVVRLLGIRSEAKGVVLDVDGVDMVNGSPVYDVKPYLPYADAVPDAKGGFGAAHSEEELQVSFACDVPEETKEALSAVLSQDPRPHYQKDGRVYGMSYRDCEVKFAVEGKCLVVLSVQRREQ